MGYSYRGGRASATRPRTRSFSGTSHRRPQQNRNRGRSQYIDPARFVKTAIPAEEAVHTPTHAFTDFAMHPLLLQNIVRKGYSNPSPIQDQAIPFGLAGRDVIGVAGTGTGKTTAFAVPLIDKLLNNPQSSALIVAPTRELAQQIEKEMQSLCAGSDIFGTLIIGGTNMRAQVRNLSKHPRIIIGTPGRIKDHVNRGSMKLRKTDIVVLDEVDRMLDMGFLPDVREILSNLNETRQSFFFSATMEDKILQLINTFTHEPKTIELSPSKTADNIEQNIVSYSGRSHKIDQLHETLIGGSVKKAIIFDETKHGVDKLHKELQSRGFKADAIHGGKSQGQRQRALSRFKNSEVDILVATDVAARGIDVIDITHVINYALPKVYDDYIHRIGRAGRAGRIGFALTFVESHEASNGIR